ncbi:MAG: hypothetical protein HRU28_14550 [Rhizobiales bacterium]|nr:hypothetical protein [Hyphomicrobiales bacterium]
MEIYKIGAGFFTSISMLSFDVNYFLTGVMIVVTIWYTIVRARGVILDNALKRKQLQEKE